MHVFLVNVNDASLQKTILLKGDITMRHNHLITHEATNNLHEQ